MNSVDKQTPCSSKKKGEQNIAKTNSSDTNKQMLNGSKKREHKKINAPKTCLLPLFTPEKTVPCDLCTENSSMQVLWLSIRSNSMISSLKCSKEISKQHLFVDFYHFLYIF